jgi:hypothetical protein
MAHKILDDQRFSAATSSAAAGHEFALSARRYVKRVALLWQTKIISLCSVK